MLSGRSWILCFGNAPFQQLQHLFYVRTILVVSSDHDCLILTPQQQQLDRSSLRPIRIEPWGLENEDCVDIIDNHWLTADISHPYDL